MNRTCERVLRFLLLALAAGGLGACASPPCGYLHSPREVRECLCAEREPAPAPAPDLIQAITDLRSPDFHRHVLAGRRLVEAGTVAEKEAVLPYLLCAAGGSRVAHEMEQDTIDSVLLLILRDMPAELRGRWLTDPDPLLRYYAVRSIAQRDAQAELPSVVSRLDDEDYYVREEAVEALHALTRRPRSRRADRYATPVPRQWKEVRRWKRWWDRHGLEWLADLQRTQEQGPEPGTEPEPPP